MYTLAFSCCLLCCLAFLLYQGVHNAIELLTPGRIVFDDISEEIFIDTPLRSQDLLAECLNKRGVELSAFLKLFNCLVTIEYNKPFACNFGKESYDCRFA